MANVMKTSQPWLSNPLKDSVLILAPSIIPVAIVVLFQPYFKTNQEVSTLWWIILVLCIDVGHVYSTLFRLYWDKSTFNNYRKVLVIIPLVAFICGFALHLYSAHWFWRILAYVAVFHFVRQQYGFMRLYSRKEQASKLSRWLDTIAIYTGTLYPLLYWHINLTSSLSWFVPGDFVQINIHELDRILLYVYIGVSSLYTIKEIWMSARQHSFNIPKNMIMLGTYLSWYVGIITFQGDLIFTFLNVVSHGIPYMGLIWIYGEKKTKDSFSFTTKGFALFLTILLLLAYFEEGIWDIFIWKDHPEVFPFLTAYTAVSHPVVMSILVAILVLPQVTHYVLDGFIWRFSTDKNARPD